VRQDQSEHYPLDPIVLFLSKAVRTGGASGSVDAHDGVDNRHLPEAPQQVSRCIGAELGCVDEASQWQSAQIRAKYSQDAEEDVTSEGLTYITRATRWLGRMFYASRKAHVTSEHSQVFYSHSGHGTVPRLPAHLKNSVLRLLIDRHTVEETKLSEMTQSIGLIVICSDVEGDAGCLRRPELVFIARGHMRVTNKSWRSSCELEAEHR